MDHHQTQPPSSDVELTRRYKKKAFEDLLQHGRIYLTLDTRVVGVRVPSEHQGKSALTIIFGLDMPTPLEDLVVDENGIEVTLSFEQRHHHCHIPWDAVWYLVPVGDKEGVLFKQSLPEAVRKTLEEDGRGDNNFVPLNLENYLEDRCCCKTKENLDKKPRHLKVVDDANDKCNSSCTESSLTTKEQCDVKEDDDSSSQHRPQLKLVASLEEEDDDDES